MSSYKRMKTVGDSDWFVRDRFGMFIHFGLYALPARHEWVKNRESIAEDKYEKYFEHFNPDMFDAREWARAAKAAGMKYAVLTVKHHEGFCLFDSKYTDYKITNTPFGRDLVAEYVAAFRAEGLKVGFYYSLLDWHHPEFPIDIHHPRRDDPDAEALDRGRDMTKYAEYMRNQVRELLTNYGKIDIIWFDFSYPRLPEGQSAEGRIKPWMQFGGCKAEKQWESDKMIAMIRELQPEILINNRLGIPQDFWTPEQTSPKSWFRHPETGEPVTWELCSTFSGSWGYYRDEQTWKSPEQLINLLVDCVANGGNMIMNVGPTSRGYIDGRAMKGLGIYGEWLKYNGRSVYGCTKAEPEFTAPAGTQLTQSEDGKRLYLHLRCYPFKYVVVPDLTADMVEYAQFLSDGSEVSYRDTTEKDEQRGLLFNLPVIPPEGICPVVEIFLKQGA